MVAGQVKDLREPLYDTYVAAKNAVLPTTITLFAKGQSDTKGLESTNLTSDAELEAPQSHQVYSVRVEFLATAAADIAAFKLKYACRLKVSGIPQLTGPIEFFPDGTTDPRATFQIPEGYQIPIDAGQKIAFEFVSSSGYTLADGTLGMVVRVYLDGIHSVQVG